MFFIYKRILRKSSSSDLKMTSRLMKIKNEIHENWEGLISIFGAFLLQLCVGSYHGTFGNLLPYITSYLRQVNMSTYNSSDSIIII